jgi:catechol 2,3-dioxygenase-like lactoylglutathione lyase family enzyme
MKFVCPLYVVEDMQRSRHFYETVLGQKVKYDFGEDVTFHGDFTIHLKDHYRTLIDNAPVTFGGNNGELYFEDDAIDAVTDAVTSAGVTLIHDLKEQPWRHKVIRFYDPDNHIVEIGESMKALCSRLSKQEGLTGEEILKQTGLPESLVSSLLD